MPDKRKSKNNTEGGLPKSAKVVRHGGAIVGKKDGLQTSAADEDDTGPLTPTQTNFQNHMNSDTDSEDDESDTLRSIEISDEDVFVDLTLPRAQIFKNFLDRIRHQNSDLPLLFKRDGLYIQSMEPGKQAWVHAQIAAEGCEHYDYRANDDMLFLTLEFKSIYGNVKSIDANDQLRIRVLPNIQADESKKYDRYNISLICVNERTKMSSEWIIDTIGDELINSRRMEARINDYWDYEYAVLASELQRRITMLSSNKTQSLYFVCQGEDLIIKQKGKFKTSMVTAIQTEFGKSFVRGPRAIAPNLCIRRKKDEPDETNVEEDSTSDEDDVGLAPEIPIIVAVELKHLVNACKGSSTNNNSKQMIHLRVSKDPTQDILIEENVGDIGKLTLGVTPSLPKK